MPYKRIAKYDLEGNLIEVYRNQTHAGQKNHIAISAITYNIRGKTMVCNQAIFREIPNGEEPPKKIDVDLSKRYDIRKKPIIYQRPDGTEIEFGTVTEAVETMKTTRYMLYKEMEQGIKWRYKNGGTKRCRTAKKSKNL